MEHEPRWLDSQEKQTWMSLGAMLINLQGALEAQMQRDSGISHFEYQVLAGLSEADDHTRRMSELAGLTNGSLSRLSHVVKRLERLGWVRRLPDPDDGRYTLAVLTEEGFAKVVEAAPGHVEEVRRLVFDPLTCAQQAALRNITGRINRAVHPDRACDDPEH
ncbi:MarR family winged helix-turn-helix transcriptional regulator [Streptomyces sp. NPDC046859]|uniref:MarR family winged helix-turn-helix transcriptional regulator n=1 Tax=Streptomyces sp. NPDC046859 TaxID=3155734 RepID=UPI003407EDA2